MLPLTLGVLVYSLFVRVGCSVCVTLPLIILYYHLPLYDHQLAPYLIIVMVMYLVNIFTQPRHPLGKI